MIDVDTVRTRFTDHCGGVPDVVVRSPGRVNLIGEHVDYCDGLVLPAAIDRGTWVAARRLAGGRVRASSTDLTGSVDVERAHLATPGPQPGEPSWAPYVRGVLALLPPAAAEVGLELMFFGDLPIGAGLSSSASLELGVAVAAQALGWPAATPAENARVCRRAENTYAHVQSGVMDQLAVAAGVQDAALLLDCRDVTFVPVPVPRSARLLILDSAAPRTLAGSAYNDRVAACRAAAAALGVSLRDAADQDVALDGLEPMLRARARHVTSEIRRTRACAAALRSGDLSAAGALMRASHASLRDDFEVSSAALDALVNEAHAEPAVYGARLTGAGFGGCVVALVRADADVGEAIIARYRARTGLPGTAFVVRASRGAHVV